VRVIEGPFVNFNGMIEDMSPERGKLKIMVQIFGRLTPVELEYYQVERA
jgi:transcriptional antiterminator NusG